MDAAYDSSDIYDYIFENAHTMPVIDTNRRRGIVQDRLTYNRKLGIALRKKRIIKIQIAVGDRKDIFYFKGNT